MRRDSRLSGVLHVLLHMAQHDGPMTSEMMAKSLDTNPVVIRRIMSGLRNRGFVRSEKGHGGGWSLVCDLASVTLRDVYNALGEPSILAMGNRTEAPGCLVEEVVNDALRKSFDDAEALLLSRFGEVTIAMLAVEVGHRLKTRKGAHRSSAKAAKAHG